MLRLRSVGSHYRDSVYSERFCVGARPQGCSVMFFASSSRVHERIFHCFSVQLCQIFPLPMFHSHFPVRSWMSKWLATLLLCLCFFSVHPRLPSYSVASFAAKLLLFLSAITSVA